VTAWTQKKVKVLVNLCDFSKMIALAHEITLVMLYSITILYASADIQILQNYGPEFERYFVKI
jgi:hypothetical protein